MYGTRMEATTQVVSPLPTTQTAAQTPAASGTQPAAAAATNATAPPAEQGDPLAALIEKVAPTSPDTPSADAAAPTGPVTGEADISLLRKRALTLPVQGVNAAQLTDTYSQARAAGTPHEAVDIMAPRGTPVLAVEDGKVLKLFLSKPGGITIYQFDPGSNYAYYYAHLDRYADGITEGASLRKGQVIGYVGSTGNASPDAPHLHFAIFKLGPERQWWRGAPLNPYLVWRDPKP
ncbi:M23 family peptidase [Polaromonas sp. SP1]|nr:M23 family peptidase [Polaromonas sp. SP1]QGJ20838.1 peptidoglycan DD-metalloendopeptidase family protein [Polaromonas sp. Pch-P]